MKNKRLWITVIILFIIAACWWVIYWLFFWNLENREKNSNLCFDAISQKIDEDAWWFAESTVSMEEDLFANLFDNKTHYLWNASYLWKDYSYTCVVDWSWKVDINRTILWDDEESCETKYQSWLEENWANSNEDIEWVSYEYEANVFYSPIVNWCVWNSTVTIINPEYNRIEIVYDIYDLDHQESLFHDREDTENFSYGYGMTLEDLKNESTSEMDYHKKLEYFWAPSEMM